MIRDLFFAAWGLVRILADDVDDILAKVAGDLINIDPICDLD